MSIKENKSRITTIVEKELENKIIEIANNEKRTKSAMVAILIEEAIKERIKRSAL